MGSLLPLLLWLTGIALVHQRWKRSGPTSPGPQDYAPPPVNSIRPRSPAFTISRSPSASTLAKGPGPQSYPATPVTTTRSKSPVVKMSSAEVSANVLNWVGSEGFGIFGLVLMCPSAGESALGQDASNHAGAARLRPTARQFHSAQVARIHDCQFTLSVGHHQRSRAAVVRTRGSKRDAAEIARGMHVVG